MTSQTRDAAFIRVQATPTLASESGDITVTVDRRKADRRTIDQPCWIDAGPGQPPHKGHLCNVSQSGAKLICGDPVSLPVEFILYMTHDGSVGRKCKVMRRANNEIGLNFVSRKVPKPHWLQTIAP